MTLFVYFIQAGDASGPIKIGYSSDVAKRIDALCTGNHLPLRLLGAIAHERADELERVLHAAFADLRLEGEWFACHRRILGVLWHLTMRPHLALVGGSETVGRCIAVFTEIVGEDDLGLPILGEIRCEQVLGHEGAHRSQHKRRSGTWTDPWTDPGDDR